MCKKPTSVPHSSTEAEIISLHAGLQMDGIPALTLWDLVSGVFHYNENQSNQAKDSLAQGDLLQRVASNKLPTTHDSSELFHVTMRLRMCDFLSPLLCCTCLRTMKH